MKFEVAAARIAILLMPLALVLALSPKLVLADRGKALILCETLTVIDGDGLICNGHHIRLFGIDAPDFHCRGRQYCTEDRVAAARSRDALVRLTRDTEVFCRPRTRDKYRRIVAKCYAHGIDLGCTMIREGHAKEWVHFSRGAYAGCQSSQQAPDRRG